MWHTQKKSLPLTSLNASWPAQVYSVVVEKLTHWRVCDLRYEIAVLQRQNGLYLMQERHTLAEINQHEARRIRLLAIQEELLRMAVPREAHLMLARLLIGLVMVVLLVWILRKTRQR